jgi:hypothetical protein
MNVPEQSKALGRKASKGDSVATRILKCVAIAALLTSVAWSASVGYRAVLAFVVTVGAIAVVSEAVRSKQPVWVALFAVVATLLNPALTGVMPHPAFIWTDLVCLAAFMASLIFVKSQPLLSIASITDRTPGSESL